VRRAGREPAPRSDPYIIGKNQVSQIGTLVERSTGFVQLLHLLDARTDDVVAEEMSKWSRPCPMNCAAP
jgi:hypothetical protein